MHFMNYSNTTTYKTTLSRFASTLYQVWTHAGLWRNTAAINSIKVYTTAGANFNTGSTFTLYGIKAA
jgi:anti-sigma-K factor RskA